MRSSSNNLEEAGYADRSTIRLGSLPHVEVPDGGFEVVGANIAAKVLIELAAALISTISDDGVIITSGVLDSRLNDVINAFEAVGGEVQSSRKIEDWTATRFARKR